MPQRRHVFPIVGKGRNRTRSTMYTHRPERTRYKWRQSDLTRPVPLISPCKFVLCLTTLHFTTRPASGIESRQSHSEECNQPGFSRAGTHAPTKSLGGEKCL